MEVVNEAVSLMILYIYDITASCFLICMVAHPSAEL